MEDWVLGQLCFKALNSEFICETKCLQGRGCFNVASREGNLINNMYYTLLI